MSSDSTSEGFIGTGVRLVNDAATLFNGAVSTAIDNMPPQFKLFGLLEKNIVTSTADSVFQGITGSLSTPALSQFQNDAAQFSTLSDKVSTWASAAGLGAISTAMTTAAKNKTTSLFGNIPWYIQVAIAGSIIFGVITLVKKNG